MTTTITRRAPMAAPRKHAKDKEATRRNKYQLNLHISDFARELLGRIANKHGINLTSALEITIREQARREGVYDLPPEQQQKL